MGAWFWKLLGGFFPTNGEKLGKLLWVGGLIFLGLTLFNRFIVDPKIKNTHNTSIASPENVIYHNETITENTKETFFGLKIMRFRVGISYN